MSNVGQNVINLAGFPTPPPATIAASGTWNSGVYTSGGYSSMAFGCTLSQTGTLTLTRYLDPAGTIAGPVITQDLVANTAGYVWSRDGFPFASFSISVKNTGGSTANLTGVYGLQSIQ